MSQSLPLPLLLPDLRLALACLYNLPYPQQQQLTMAQAQEFLIYFQSRNMRRKMESLIQRQRDKPQKEGSLGGATSGEPVRAGSSWLASVALLCQQHGSLFAASHSERLFAAQTLLHRLVRNKMDQAIDWEMEVSVEGGRGDDVRNLLFHQIQHPVPLNQMVEHYQRIVHHYNPFVGSVVAQYAVPQPAEEERVKGELSLLTLTAIVYVTAVQGYTNPQQEAVGPLLNTLGAAVGALALRLRFPATSTKNNPQQQQQQQQSTSPPLVTLVTQSLSLVFQTAGAALHQEASSDVLRACLSALPDICLGGSGGARGRMSIDPKSLNEAGRELRTTGLVQLWDLLQQHVSDMQQAPQVHANVLTVCERWARFLPLPLEFLQHTIPLASQYITAQSSPQSETLRRAALCYLVAIYEGATWTPEQILAKALGVGEQNQASKQQGKKRQTSKSKKRQQEAVQNRTTSLAVEEASAEYQHRGTMACHTTIMAWEGLRQVFRAALTQANANASAGAEIQIEGEGPIGCLAACANACLPHLLRTSSTPLGFPQAKDLFVAISETFQEMCRSQHRVIRAFSMETIFSLHKTLVQHVLETEEGQHPSLDAELQSVIVDFFFKCSMSLATSCGYPDDYFHNLGAISDEELEIERNDVRDVLRTVAVSERGGSTAFADISRQPLDVTLQVLTRLLQACGEAVQEAQSKDSLFPETAVHCFSALAKPLNQLSKCYAKTSQPSSAVDILKLALQIFRNSLQIVIGAFPTAAVQDIFPAIRVADLGIASLSPMLSNLCSLPQFREEVLEVLRLCLNAAATSVTMLPELATPSILGNDIYDIRGAMRGPGGEDHVGCLAIMRMTFESDVLACTLIEAAGADIPKLAQLHAQLKSIEVSRERGNVHGSGVTPKSRRILLGVICHLEIVSNGASGCSAMLTDLFNAAITAISAYSSADPSCMDDEKVVLQICECTWDLGAFSPVIIESLFNYEGESASSKLACLRVLTSCICRGYQRLQFQDEFSPVDIEWNRLRAGFFALLGACPALPNFVCESLEAINRAECEAINNQCRAGPTSFSSLFNDEVVSTECVPSGVFLRLIHDRIGKIRKEHRQDSSDSLSNCVAMLHKVKAVVLPAITLPCPDPVNFVDPRPTQYEAWLLTMTALAELAATTQIKDEIPLKEVLVESCVATIALLFSPVMSKQREIRSQSPCMSFEGPHTLALNAFLTSFFLLGPNMLQEVGQGLLQRIPVDTEKAKQYSTDVGCLSASIVGAALFRATQGALPPWAAEFLAEIYSAFFAAMNKNVDAFVQMLRLSMELKLLESAPAFGSVQPGQLLSGPAFYSTKESAKSLFLHETLEQCRLDNNAAWKRMKVLLKKLSGGKKTDVDFIQKPSPTKWEFDRL